MKRMSTCKTIRIFTLALTAGSFVLAQDDFDFEALLGGVDDAVPAGEAAASPVSDADMQSLLEEPAAEPVAMEPVSDDTADLGFQADAPAEPAADGDEGAEDDTGDRMKAAVEADYQERVRKEARRMEGLKALDNGYAAMQNGRWANAVDLFEEALSKLQPIPELQPYIDMARQQESEAYLQMAKGLYERRREGGDLAQAEEFIRKASAANPGDPRPAELAAQINKYRDDVAKRKIEQPIGDEPKYKNASKNIDDLMERGRKEYKIGDYDQADKTFEQVLLYDRYNRDALRFLEKVAEKRWEARRQERKTSVMRMMDEGEKRWLLPMKIDQTGPKEDLSTTESSVVNPSAELEQKLSKIIIPEIRFQNAEITAVIQYLVQQSREVDEAGIGVNIIFMDPTLSGGADDAGAAAPAAAPAADPFGFLGGGAGGAPAAVGGATSAMPRITLELRNVSLLDALKFVTEIAGLYYRVERNVVIIEREGRGKLITRFYPVDPARWVNVANTMGSGRLNNGGGNQADPFAADPFGGGGGAAAASDGPDLKALFERYGVTIPPGGEIAYEPLIAQLVVTLTPDQFPKFEDVLAKINVSPRQVQIEARFVEVLQRDLDQLGFEWILNDDAEVLVKDGPGPVAARPRVQVDRNLSGLTSGLRYFDFDGTSNVTQPKSRSTVGVGNNFLGDILSVSGILTNPELTAVVQAINQKGNTDLLSAPRVTTINGVNAIIEVVEEIIYPTEFDVTENDVEVNGGNNGTTGVAVFVPPTVIPGGFETRSVGVILNVTPTVGSDNYTINLTMLPEIAELVDWIQYGTQIPIGNQVFTVNMPQPVFASRNVTTTMIVWDGHTVVMGGLIREDLTTFKDKVPLLGDIPLIGRLFRSEGTQSEKRNLLIFVTARLVDPAGNPVNANRQDLVSDRELNSRGSAVSTGN